MVFHSINPNSNQAMPAWVRKRLKSMLTTALILLLMGWLAAEFLSPFLIIIPPPGHRYNIPNFDQGYFQEFELETFDQLKLSAYEHNEPPHQGNRDRPGKETTGGIFYSSKINLSRNGASYLPSPTV